MPADIPAATYPSDYHQHRAEHDPEALPRNPSGKILERDLRKQYWADQDRQV